MALIINTRSSSSSSVHSMGAAVFVGLLLVSSLFVSTFAAEYRTECNDVAYDCHDKTKPPLCDASCRAKSKSHGYRYYKPVCDGNVKPSRCCCTFEIRT
ncbi:hypothetical protein SORBI_3005G223300 [Sorghum bicolor]|uniref:Knottin scorpion toxin-like domain-containing protein n=1 Tax=Sorghum bicolor TaxID=4558 RepID=A0A1B6PU32_SORBI|nr:hypothetical protein SORBI_3005G223300 [Sorghum bicolor]